MKLILASTSPYRAAQLRRLGLKFDTCDPKVDENLFKQAGLSPETLAETLAMENLICSHAIWQMNILSQTVPKQLFLFAIHVQHSHVMQN